LFNSQLVSKAVVWCGYPASGGKIFLIPPTKLRSYNLKFRLEAKHLLFEHCIVSVKTKCDNVKNGNFRKLAIFTFCFTKN